MDYLPPFKAIGLEDYGINSITGCWIWRRHCDPHGYAVDDYGRFVDRQIYQEHKGPIPEGYEINHLCWHRRCINPEHLEAEACIYNNRVSPMRILDVQKAREIRAKAAAGIPTVVLAQEYFVAVTTIRSVLLNVTWTDPEYRPQLKYHSRKEANPKTVRRVRSLRAGGMSYGKIVDHIHLTRSRVIAYCSGRYLSPEFNIEFKAAPPKSTYSLPQSC